jgi:hypothetical protein
VSTIFFKISRLIFCLLLFFSYTSYGSRGDLKAINPDEPLGAAASNCVREVQAALCAQEEPQDSQGAFSGVVFDDVAYVPPLKPSAAQCFAHDQQALAGAQSTLLWISEQIGKVRASLKTSAARKTLDAILDEARIDISDIERALNRWSRKLPKKYQADAVDICLHERFQKASSKAFSILMNHITAGILYGSKDEKADLQALCACFCTIDSMLDDCFEQSAIYSALRRRSIECYDAVPASDFLARAAILEQINRLGEHAVRTVDDGDDYAVQSSVLELTETCLAAMRLRFVNRTHPDMQLYVFDTTPWRLHYFLKHAPDLFEFCRTNAGSIINAQFSKDKWQNWTQVHQTIWVDPKGCISVRLKTDGSKRFTVGFLGESPYYRSYTGTLCLDWRILGDRRTEMLKFSPYRGEQFTIPAALNGDTPYWRPASQLLIDGIVASAHGKTL